MAFGPSCWRVNGTGRPMRLIEKPSPWAMATPGFVAVVGRGAGGGDSAPGVDYAAPNRAERVDRVCGSPGTRWLLCRAPISESLLSPTSERPALAVVSETARYETRPLVGSRAGVFRVRNSCPKSTSHSYAGPWVSRLLGRASSSRPRARRATPNEDRRASDRLKRRAQPLFERVKTRTAGAGQLAPGQPARVG
jgi:hypothetical protein